MNTKSLGEEPSSKEETIFEELRNTLQDDVQNVEKRLEKIMICREHKSIDGEIKTGQEKT